MGGGGEVVGVVVGGAGAAGAEVTGVVDWVTGAGVVAGVGAGMVGFAPVLAFECGVCVVDVTGRVVEEPGTVVVGAAGAAGAAATALAGMPLFNTANHEPATFWPCACPFFLSPA